MSPLNKSRPCFGLFHLYFTPGKENVNAFLKVSLSDLFKICCFYSACMDTVSAALFACYLRACFNLTIMAKIFSSNALRVVHMSF